MGCQKKFIGEIVRTGGRIIAARNALLEGFGATSAKFRLLKTIRRVPTPFTVSELARVMKVSRQTAQPVVNRLEADGLVRLEINLRNSRAPLVVMTETGRAKLEQLRRVEDRWIADLARGFDESLLAQTAWVLRQTR